jgi:hypothetical protein
MSTATIPFTITPEAAAFIEERKLQVPFQRMLDNIPSRFPRVEEICVSLQYPQDDDDELPRVILDVQRDDFEVDDPLEKNWDRWVIATFPPEEFSHFCLISNYGPANERPTIS